MQKQAELYRGKAKTVYSTENPDLLVLEFRNDTSAGDGAQRILLRNLWLGEQREPGAHAGTDLQSQRRAEKAV